MDSSQNLIRMANQIAQNLGGYSRDEAITLLTQHLQKFWEPRMRRQLHDYVHHGGGGLHEFVLEAEKNLK